jgi:hypothetical protein
VSAGITEKPRITRYLARVSPPPLTSLAIAVDYANIALDPDVSLYERFTAVSTAVRLACTIPGWQSLSSPRMLLEESGLCDRLREVSEREVCSSRRGDIEVLRNLVEVVNACERGEIPVTDDLVLTLAQAVIVMLVPRIRVTLYQQPPLEVPGDLYQLEAPGK